MVEDDTSCREAAFREGKDKGWDKINRGLVYFAVTIFNLLIKKTK
jgi:hypothetical protein